MGTLGCAVIEYNPCLQGASPQRKGCQLLEGVQYENSPLVEVASRDSCHQPLHSAPWKAPAPHFFLTGHEGNLLPPVAKGEYPHFHMNCAQQWQARKYHKSGVAMKLPHTTGMEILNTWSPGVLGPAGLAPTETPMVVGAPRSYLAPRALAMPAPR